VFGTVAARLFCSLHLALGWPRGEAAGGRASKCVSVLVSACVRVGAWVPKNTATVAHSWFLYWHGTYICLVLLVLLLLPPPPPPLPPPLSHCFVVVNASAAAVDGSCWHSYLCVPTAMQPLKFIEYFLLSILIVTYLHRDARLSTSCQSAHLTCW